ncbi:hypothetical protein TRVL_09506 [Trypanosoma vivax]|nr:hypothetical protein TRVL_09506 [Trypanosoma vivax]
MLMNGSVLQGKNRSGAPADSGFLCPPNRIGDRNCQWRRRRLARRRQSCRATNGRGRHARVLLCVKRRCASGFTLCIATLALGTRCCSRRGPRFGRRHNTRAD